MLQENQAFTLLSNNSRKILKNSGLAKTSMIERQKIFEKKMVERAQRLSNSSLKPPNSLRNSIIQEQNKRMNFSETKKNQRRGSKEQIDYIKNQLNLDKKMQEKKSFLCANNLRRNSQQISEMEEDIPKLNEDEEKLLLKIDSQVKLKNKEIIIKNNNMEYGHEMLSGNQLNNHSKENYRSENISNQEASEMRKNLKKKNEYINDLFEKIKYKNELYKNEKIISRLDTKAKELPLENSNFNKFQEMNNMNILQNNLNVYNINSKLNSKCSKEFCKINKKEESNFKIGNTPLELADSQSKSQNINKAIPKGFKVVIERNEKWLKTKNDKIKKMGEDSRNKHLEECTFFPHFESKKNFTRQPRMNISCRSLSLTKLYKDEISHLSRSNSYREKYELRKKNCKEDLGSQSFSKGSQILFANSEKL